MYGSGKVGLMGLLADTVLKNNGEVIGVVLEFLMGRELSHPNLTELHIITTMSKRKSKMVDFGHACIALLGGLGTLEGITGVISSSVGQNDGPCMFYNVNNFYQPMENMYNDMVDNVF
ncbi:LOG family protein [Staphylococcus gallinarum]|uniref:LOG family protein n=1 Tax=Staphylococcus gallinarum TaxID=1293 RepID=UPI00311C9069